MPRNEFMNHEDPEEELPEPDEMVEAIEKEAEQYRPLNVERDLREILQKHASAGSRTAKDLLDELDRRQEG